MNENIGHLYRFRHLQGEHREWTEQILVESNLHIADPQSLNDPFDCKVHYSNSVSLGDLKQYYTRILKENLSHLNREQHRAKVVSDISRISPDDFISQMAASGCCSEFSSTR